jgi:competence protein ComEA
MRKKSKILHGIGTLALVPVLSVLLCGCRKADSALLIAAQESEAETVDNADAPGNGTDGSGASGSGATSDAGTDGTDETGSTGADDTAGARGNSDGTDGFGDSTEEDGLYIYICGEVINPGVYILDATARLCDAVEAAGGMTESASRTYWNLAMQLSDGQMIYIPSMEEAAERDFSPLTAEGTSGTDGTGSASGAGDAAGSTGTDAGNSSGAGSTATANGSTGSSSGSVSSSGISADGKVNINTATKEQLMTVPGIGSAKADSIIAYRETNGAYAAIDDIMNVSGIKEGLFQSMKEYITVD